MPKAAELGPSVQERVRRLKDILPITLVKQYPGRMLVALFDSDGSMQLALAGDRLLDEPVVVSGLNEKTYSGRVVLDQYSATGLVVYEVDFGRSISGAEDKKSERMLRYASLEGGDFCEDSKPPDPSAVARLVEENIYRGVAIPITEVPQNSDDFYLKAVNGLGQAGATLQKLGLMEDEQSEWDCLSVGYGLSSDTQGSQAE